MVHAHITLDKNVQPSGRLCQSYILVLLDKGEREAEKGDVALGITSLHVVILTVRERPEPLPLLDTDDLSMFVATFV